MLICVIRNVDRHNKKCCQRFNKMLIDTITKYVDLVDIRMSKEKIMIDNILAIIILL